MPPFNEKNVYTGRARMRARDIREALQNRNIDPAIIHTFEGLADNDKTLRDQIEALATLVNNCIDVITTLTNVINQVQGKIPDLTKVDNLATTLTKGIATEAIKTKDPDET